MRPSPHPCLVRFLFEHPLLSLAPSHSCFLGRWCRLVYYYLADYVFSLLSTSVLTYNIDNNKKSNSSSSSRQQNQHLYHSLTVFSLFLPHTLIPACLHACSHICVRKCMFRTKMPISIYNLCIYTCSTHKAARYGVCCKRTQVSKFCIALEWFIIIILCMYWMCVYKQRKAICPSRYIVETQHFLNDGHQCERLGRKEMKFNKTQN